MVRETRTGSRVTVLYTSSTLGNLSFTLVVPRCGRKPRLRARLIVLATLRWHLAQSPVMRLGRMPWSPCRKRVSSGTFVWWILSMSTRWQRMGASWRRCSLPGHGLRCCSRMPYTVESALRWTLANCSMDGSVALVYSWWKSSISGIFPAGIAASSPYSLMRSWFTSSPRAAVETRERMPSSTSVERASSFCMAAARAMLSFCSVPRR
mmetsp:Transcript_582/g.1947  ORF Transcript_582/g.1947 Transcript_582/m.1947 type:complete len:208 (-) Transcript_582:239-862(-)